MNTKVFDFCFLKVCRSSLLIQVTQKCAQIYIEKKQILTQEKLKILERVNKTNMLEICKLIKQNLSENLVHKERMF